MGTHPSAHGQHARPAGIDRAYHERLSLIFFVVLAALIVIGVHVASAGISPLTLSEMESPASVIFYFGPVGPNGERAAGASPAVSDTAPLARLFAE